MGILEDIKKLGCTIEPADQDEIDKIVEKVKKEKKDENIRNAVLEGELGDFLNAWRPDIMEAIVKERQREADEWVRLTRRKFDEKGDRLCDEQFCPSTDGVAQCVHCGKYICREHNYIKESRCCYDCFVERFGKENT
jgi:hypothetical protein